MQPGRAAMIPMITHCILATRAHGLEILDGPYSDITNIDGFAAECTQGRDLGFDGKTLIHPGQIEACNAIFTPPAEEVAEARKIIAAFEAGERLERRDPARRPHGRTAARRDGQAHDCDRGCDRGDGELRSGVRFFLSPAGEGGAKRRMRGCDRHEGLSVDYPSPVANELRSASLSPQGRGKHVTKSLRRPCIQTARDRLLPRRGLWRDVQSDDLGIGDQRGKIRWLEKQFRFGMHRIERFLRQRVM